MSLYELATLNLNMAGFASAPAAAASFAAEPAAKGRLLGCWRSDVGELNKLILLRAFATQEDLHAERVRTRTSSNPFNCGDKISSMRLESFAPIKGFEDVQPGEYADIYELRNYRLRPGGVASLIPAWEAAAPRRDAFSKLLLVMYSLDGEDRWVHLWPYPSFEERARVRVAVAAGCEGWPPPVGFDWVDLTDMRSDICLPTPESLLR